MTSKKMTDEQRHAISASLTGYQQSDEHRDKIRDKALKRKKVICSCCGSEIAVNVIKRHEEKCRNK